MSQLATGLPPQKPGFITSAVHVGFVVDKVALGYFSSFGIIPPMRLILTSVPVAI